MGIVMPFLSIIFISFLAISSISSATPAESTEEKQKHISLIKKWDKNISIYKKLIHNKVETQEAAKLADVLFNAYMQKAAGHYHIEEKEEQLKCYQDILNIEGLTPVTLARTHINISVVYLHHRQLLLAAGHLKKAEEFATIQDIEKVMGARAYRIFADVYDKVADSFYSNHPRQALVYQLKTLQTPGQDEKWYGQAHLKLSILYDRLLESETSLNHAIQALSCKALSSCERDRALAFATIGSADTDKFSECVRYFKQIKAPSKLESTEYFLLYTTIGNIYLRENKWQKGIAAKHKAIEVLQSSSPQSIIAKYELAIIYGKNKNKEKELELYNEILGFLCSSSFEDEWQDNLKSIKKLVKLFFFTKQIDEIERFIHRKLETKTAEKGRDLESQALQESLKKKRGKKVSKEKLHHRRIEAIKYAQKIAAEQEYRLNQENLKKATKQKERAEESLIEEPFNNRRVVDEKFTLLSSPYIPKEEAPKIKTRGVAATKKEEPKKEISSLLPETSTIFPKFGTRAQAVFNKIEGKDWNFTREDYTYYLKDLHCKRRENGGSHRIFKMPKTSIISLEREGERFDKHIFLGEEALKLGSVTLPKWEGKHIPFYLRKQLRMLHKNIIRMYTLFPSRDALTEY